MPLNTVDTTLVQIDTIQETTRASTACSMSNLPRIMRRDIIVQIIDPIFSVNNYYIGVPVNLKTIKKIETKRNRPNEAK